MNSTFLSPENRVTEDFTPRTRVDPTQAVSRAAVVLQTERGPGRGLHPSTPTSVRSLPEYEATFGRSGPGWLHARNFFGQVEGLPGVELVVIRAVHFTDPDDATTYDASASTLQLRDSSAVNTYLLTASSVGRWSRAYRITTRKVDTVTGAVAVAVAGSTAATAAVVTGTEAAPWNFGGPGSLSVAVNGGGPTAVAFTATAATLTSSGATYAGVSSGMHLDLSVNGVAVTTTFAGTEITQGDFRTAILAAAVAASASLSIATASTELTYTSGVRGSSSSVNVLSTTSAAVLTALGLTVGTHTGTGNVANIAAVAGAEFTSIVSGALTGAVGSVSSTHARISTTATGTSATLQVSAGTIATALGLPTTAATGAAATTATATSVQMVSTSGVSAGDLLRFGATMMVTVTSVSSDGLVGFASTTVPVGGLSEGDAVYQCTWTLTVIPPRGPSAVYSELRCSPLSPNAAELVLARTAGVVVTAATPSASADPRPADITAVPLAGGLDGSAVTDTDIIGSATARTGLLGLSVSRRSVPMHVFVPDASVTVLRELYGMAEGMKRFLATGSVPYTVGSVPGDVAAWVRSTLQTPTSYGRLVFPRIRTNDPRNSSTVLACQSAYAVGAAIRTSILRGPWKAPAGTTDGRYVYASGVEVVVEQSDYDVLYPAGVNAALVEGTGVCLMGNQTLYPSTTAAIGSVGIRLSLLYLLRSIGESTRWVLFEDNARRPAGSTNPGAASRLASQIKRFFREYWRRGGLDGTKEAEAFAVMIGTEGTGTSGRYLGASYRVRPVNSAEFVDQTLAELADD